MTNEYNASRKINDGYETQLKVLCRLYKEENRKLRKELDLLNLELMVSKGNSQTSKRYKTDKPVQNPKVNQLNVSRASYDHFPIILSTQSTFISKILYPTKKLAYYYAVLGVKGTAKKIGRFLKKKRSKN
ncbi:MAG: hypothetical protein E6230_05375 [Paenibacillus dendritiformis]|uniref:hypothetical protein n=1 Tax=uncultured Paenibacillus sp. TaxID=227322 RepID=UPI0025F11D4F|nr:hypothetical protein [uncultured Paenibacillus sp.]MDU5141604.1 hypothetical protein [Paenibacillus dendritiformis]